MNKSEDAKIVGSPQKNSLYPLLQRSASEQVGQSKSMK